MLKAEMQPREIRAAAYLHWLRGEGAVAVLEREEDALLMERAGGDRSLVEIEAREGARAAFTVLCELAETLHSIPRRPPPEAFRLAVWMGRLGEVSSSDPFFETLNQDARRLLADEREIKVLHGDLHHWNVLDGGRDRGWLAIDPNGLVGERCFDYALMVLPTNGTEDTNPRVLAERAEAVARLAGLETRRLLQWTAVQAALWAAWSAPGRDWVAVANAARAAGSD